MAGPSVWAERDFIVPPSGNGDVDVPPGSCRSASEPEALLSGGDAGVAERALFSVDPARWDPRRQSVDHQAGPAAAGEVVVVVRAQKGEVVEVRAAALGPFDDVVDVGPFGGAGAAGDPAAAVAGEEPGPAVV